MFLFPRAVFEAGEFLQESERHIARRAVALLGDDELGFAFALVFLLLSVGVIFLPNEKPNQVGVLLDAARFAQVAQTRPAFAVAGAVFRISIELRGDDDRNVQLLGEAFDAGGDFRDLDLAVLLAAPRGRAQELEVIDDDQLDLVLRSAGAALWRAARECSSPARVVDEDLGLGQL